MTSDTSQCHPLLFLNVSGELWRVGHLSDSRVLHGKQLRLILATGHIAGQSATHLNVLTVYVCNVSAKESCCDFMLKSGTLPLCLLCKALELIGNTGCTQHLHVLMTLLIPVLMFPAKLSATEGGGDGFLRQMLPPKAVET